MGWRWFPLFVIFYCWIMDFRIFTKFTFFEAQKFVNPRPAGVWLVTRPAPISKFQTPFDSPVRELPVQGQKFDPEVTDDVTGRVKVRIFDFSGLVTSASKISMLSANKANESAWKRSNKLRYMFLVQIFAKNAKNEPKTLFEASKSVKKQHSENHGKVRKWREKYLFLTCFMSYLSHF